MLQRMASVEERRGEEVLTLAEEEPELSAETFSVLAEFYREQEEREMRQAEAAAGSVEPEVAEDWQLSQFWYSEDTAAALARAVAAAVGDNDRRFIGFDTFFFDK